MFQLNEDGATLFEAFFLTKYDIYCVKEKLRIVLMEPISKNREVDSKKNQKVIECLNMVRCSCQHA